MRLYLVAFGRVFYPVGLLSAPESLAAVGSGAEAQATKQVARFFFGVYPLEALGFSEER